MGEAEALQVLSAEVSMPSAEWAWWCRGSRVHEIGVCAVVFTVVRCDAPGFLRCVVGGGAAAGGTCVCQYQGDGGAGGGTTGVSGVCSANDCGYRPAGTGGSQIAGGTGQTEAIAASFGQGASASLLTNDCIQGGGGGGGWYGGGAGGQAGGGGGGGSGYLNPTLTATQILDGNSVMPDTLGNNMTGNNGNGIAKITW